MRYILYYIKAEVLRSVLALTLVLWKCQLCATLVESGRREFTTSTAVAAGDGRDVCIANSQPSRLQETETYELETINSDSLPGLLGKERS